MNYFTQSAKEASRLADIFHRVREAVYVGRKIPRIPTDAELIELRAYLITMDRFISITGSLTSETYGNMALNITDELRKRARRRKKLDILTCS